MAHEQPKGYPAYFTSLCKKARWNSLFRILERISNVRFAGRQTAEREQPGLMSRTPHSSTYAWKPPARQLPCHRDFSRSSS